MALSNWLWKRLWSYCNTEYVKNKKRGRRRRRKKK